MIKANERLLVCSGVLVMCHNVKNRLSYVKSLPGEDGMNKATYKTPNLSPIKCKMERVRQIGQENPGD